MKFKTSCDTTLPFGRPVPTSTGVLCPECQKEELHTSFNCFVADFSCPTCFKRFSLEKLVTVLTDEEFELLADKVAFRFSDRV